MRSHSVSRRTLALLALAIGKEVYAAASWPGYDRQRVVVGSERLSWIAQHSTGRDLVIGENAVEIPFHFNRSTALSYSPYPTTDYLTYRGLLDYLAIRGAEHERIYLVITRHGEPNEGVASTYGPFITDLMFGRTHSYPCIVADEREARSVRDEGAGVERQLDLDF
jgi:hypothetical protein